MKQSKTSFCTTVSLYLRSGIFLLGQVVSTLVIFPFMLMMKPWGYEVCHAVAVRWVRFNLWTLERVCGLGFDVHGAGNIPAGGGGLILCKHQSAFETLALQVIFPSVVFILKQELLKIPVWGWGMALLEPIAIDRQAKSQALKQILRDGARRIGDGRWIALFPEGTRVAPGQRGQYGGSGGMLAHRSGCAVVPVAHNAGEFWPRHSFLKLPGRIQIHVGPVLDGAVLSAAELNQQAEAWIEQKMLEISGAIVSPVA